MGFRRLLACKVKSERVRVSGLEVRACVRGTRECVCCVVEVLVCRKVWSGGTKGTRRR